jgi:nicotinamide mononucleotide (NMN) deamidase PncC
MLEEKMGEIIKILRERYWTIGVMESCTGGAIANCITNIPGVSDVFGEGKVTYCDEAKIKAGVGEKTIKKYGVASKEVAKEMAKKIVGEIGVGVTGNLPGKVFVVVRVKNNFFSEIIETKSTLSKPRRIEARIEMKKKVVERVVNIIIDSI